MKYCGDCGEVYFGDLADATHCLHCVWENDSPKALIYRSGKHALGISPDHLRIRHTQNIDERIKTAQEAIKEAGLDFSVKVNDACEE